MSEKHVAFGAALVATIAAVLFLIGVPLLDALFVAVWPLAALAGCWFAIFAKRKLDRAIQEGIKRGIRKGFEEALAEAEAKRAKQ